MALFSDIDWIILLGVGGLLLLGRGNATLLRQLGRYYGRLVRLKRELLDEVSRAADLPPPVPGRPTSLRQAFLGEPAPSGRASGIPVAVAAAPSPRLVPPVGVTPLVAQTGLGGTWSVATPAMSSDEAMGR